MKSKYPKYKSNILAKQRRRQLLAIILVLVFLGLLIILSAMAPFPYSVLSPLVLIVVTFIFINPVFVFRVCYRTIALNADEASFPHKNIQKGKNVFFYEKDDNNQRTNLLLDEIFGEHTKTILEDTKTTAFIIISNNILKYEEYLNGSKRHDLQMTYSITKTFTSILLGLAWQDKKIKSVHDPIEKYLPELSKRNKNFSKILIHDLISMSSGIRFRGGYDSLFGDNTREFYTTNLRKDVLKKSQIEEEPGKHFWYNNYNTDIIGLILERIYKKPLSHLLEERIWKPIGAEFNAKWNVDSNKHKFEKTSCGLRAAGIDLAKIGSLYLNNGNFSGSQIISRDWIKKSTTPDEEKSEKFYEKKSFFSSSFEDGYGYYKFFWWGRKNKDGFDFMARGVNSNFIFVSPANNTVIVRCGLDYGFHPDDWIKIFTDISSNINK